MRQTVTIRAPEVKQTDNGVELATRFEYDGKPYKLWFAVEPEFAEYLTHERSDAFLIALLPWAMYQGVDLCFEAPITKELFFRVTYYLMPILKTACPWRTVITINAPLADEPLPNKGACGTGLSCGVDSLATIYDCLVSPSAPPPPYRLTHLTFFNVGSHHPRHERAGSDEFVQKLYKERLEFIREAAKDIGLPLVAVNSNLKDFIPSPYNENSTFCLVAAVHVVGKLFASYYLSTSVPVSLYTLGKFTELAEPVLLPLMGSGNLSFFSSDPIKSRNDKCDTIKDWPIAHKWLNVCTGRVQNCSRCGKCLITMILLDSSGRLDPFHSVFDLAYYYKNRYRLWARMERVSFIGRTWEMQQCRERVRHSGKRLPFSWVWWYNVYFFKYIHRKFKRLIAKESGKPVFNLADGQG